MQALLLAWALVCLFPLYWIAITSLKGEADIARGPVYLPFVDFTPTLDAWRFVLFYPNENLQVRFLNSFIVSTSAAVLTLVIASLAVYALTRCRGHAPRPGLLGDRSLFAMLLASRVLPPIVIVLPVYLGARTVGLLDTRLVLIVVYAAINLPVAVWLLRAVFGGTPSEQEEAALLDGASHLRIVVEILLPMVVRHVLAIGLLVFVLCWTEYLFAAWLTSTKAVTLPPWVAGQLAFREAQVGGDPEEWPRFCAAAVLMILPPLACVGAGLRLLASPAARRER